MSTLSDNSNSSDGSITVNGKDYEGGSQGGSLGSLSCSKKPRGRPCK